MGRLVSVQLHLKRDDWRLLSRGTAGWVHLLLLSFHFFFLWVIPQVQGTFRSVGFRLKEWEEAQQ